MRDGIRPGLSSVVLYELWRGMQYRGSGRGTISEAGFAEVMGALHTAYRKYDSGYGYMYGTSMACPHVSGVAALGLAYATKLGKRFTVKEFKSLLLSSVNDIDSGLLGAVKDYGEGTTVVAPQPGVYKGKMGTGAVDAWRFMMNIEGTPCSEAVCGKSQGIDLSEWFGASSSQLTYGNWNIPRKICGAWA